MVWKETELCCKEVINVRDGSCLGYVSDVEIDTATATVTSLIIYGKCKWFGLFGREDDLCIPWEHIKVIGEDTILVNFRAEYRERRSKRTGLFSRIQK